MKRFRHLKPIKAKGVFYNAKNTTGMRFKQKASNALVYVILTIISLIWILPFVIPSAVFPTPNSTDEAFTSAAVLLSTFCPFKVNIPVFLIT